MYPFIDLYMCKMCLKTLYLLNNIRALIFFTPLNIKAVNPSQCSCASVSSSQGFDLPKLDSIPLGQHAYIIINIISLEASFSSSNIASKGNTQQRMPQRSTCHSKFYSFFFSINFFLYTFFLRFFFFKVIMPQASGRIIHGNQRPKDNDVIINKD